MWGHLNESPEIGLRRSNKKRLLLWGGLGAFLLLAVVALTVAIVAKLTADSIARESRPATITYVEDVIKASQASADPQGIVTAVGAIKAPVFKSVLFGEISSDYRNAKKVHENAIAKVDEFTKKMSGYAQTLEFYSSYQKLKTQIQTLESTNTTVGGKTKDMAYLDKYRSLLSDANNLIEKTTVSSDYSNEFVELGRVYGSMALNMEGVTTALKQNNTLGFNNIFDQYSMAAAQIPRVETSLGAYIDSVPGKVTAARDDLKKYRSQL